MCCMTNAAQRTGSIAESMEGADVVIALSRPGPGVIKKEWVKKMAPNAIVFVCANPIPEMWPWEATEAGAAVVATGRSDFPNQVNNSLGFPAVFRGALDVRAHAITDEMCLVAARELAACIPDSKIKPDHILPTMSDWRIYPRIAAAVGVQAIAQKVAGIKASRSALYDTATAIISRSRAVTDTMMKKRFIKKPPR